MMVPAPNAQKPLLAGMRPFNNCNQESFTSSESDLLNVDDSSHLRFKNDATLKPNEFTDTRMLESFSNPTIGYADLDANLLSVYGVPTQKRSTRSNIRQNEQTWQPYTDWNRWDEHGRAERQGNALQINNNGYSEPTSQYNINGQWYYPSNNQLNYETQIFPYHAMQAYDPYDFAPIDGWKAVPNRTIGNGISRKSGFLQDKSGRNSM